MNPAPHPLPPHYRTEALREIREAGAATWARTEASTDVPLMLELWRSIRPEDRELALQMADANRAASANTGD